MEVEMKSTKWMSAAAVAGVVTVVVVVAVASEPE